MTENTMKNRIRELISRNQYLICSDSASTEDLVNQSEIIKAKQGQTLSRSDVLEDSAFLIVEGTVRLLAKDTHGELYTVGMAREGDFIGLIDLLRQEPCEAAIARQESTLLKIPIELITKFILENKILIEKLNMLGSKCEKAKVLTRIYAGLTKPPLKEQEWIKTQINSGENDEPEKILLSSVVEGYEKRVGEEVTDEEKEILKEKSKLPVRYISLAKVRIIKKNVDNITDRKIREEEKSKSGESMVLKSEPWQLGDTLNYSDIGVREEHSINELTGFKLIKGKGLVGANLSTLRMAANFYNTPCPVDVIEKILESAEERAGSIPIQGMGQLAESMGLQTQIGDVPLKKLKELEFPVLFQEDKYFSLIANADGNMLKIADPERGWRDIGYAELQEEFGDSIKVVLLKRLSDTLKKLWMDMVHTCSKEI